MSDRLDELLDRVRMWPPERRAQAEEVLDLLEQIDGSAQVLSDDQIEEVERRLSEAQAGHISMAQVRARFLDGDG